MSAPYTQSDAYRVLHFWFSLCSEDDWFNADSVMDEKLKELFLPMYEAARDGQLEEWKEMSTTALALILLLDTFPRHMFRGTKQAYATDALALRYAVHLGETGLHYSLGDRERAFIMMPFMHAEAEKYQKISVDLFEVLGEEPYLTWAHRRKEVIEKFRRFPHRNAILGRDSTDEEKAYLEQAGEHPFGS